MEWSFNALFPARYVPQQQPAKYDQIILFNWLDIEIEQDALHRIPVLELLSGHRNKDVFNYVKETNVLWDAKLSELLYH